MSSYFQLYPLNIPSLHYQCVWLVSACALPVRINAASDGNQHESADGSQSHPTGECDNGVALGAVGDEGVGGIKLVKFLHDSHRGELLLELLTLLVSSGDLDQLLADGTRNVRGLFGQALAEVLEGHSTNREVRRAQGLCVLVALLSRGGTLAVLPEGHLGGAGNLALAVRASKRVVVLGKALEHHATTVLTLRRGANLVHIGFALLGNTGVHLPVGRHPGLPLLHLSLAAVGEVRLHQARLQAPEDATLATLDLLAVHVDLLLAHLERGTQANVLGLDSLQPLLLPLARGRQGRLVRDQALVNTATAGLDVGTEVGHILLASLLQYGVGAVVVAHTLLSSKELSLARVGCDVRLAVHQALDDGASTGLALEWAADISAQLIDLHVTLLVQAVIQAVILCLTDLVTLDLGTALGAHLLVLVVLLKAGDHTSVTVRDVLAEQLDLRLASLLHGVLEVDVLRQAHLLIEEGCTALVRELVAVVLQAAQDACRARRHSGAQSLAVLVASVSERTIHADVLRSALGDRLHDSLATRSVELILVVLQALDDTAVVASDGVEGILLVAAHFLNVVAALLTHIAVQTEVRSTAHHHLLELGLALRGEIRLLAILLETHLRAAHARLHIRAELLLVLAAQTQENSVEAQVVRVLNLLAEKLLLAVPGKLSALLAQALLHPAATGLHTVAQSRSIVSAELVQHGISNKVLRRLLLLLENLVLASGSKLLLNLPEASDDRARLWVQRRIVTVLLGIILAGTGEHEVQVDVGGPLSLERADLLLANLRQLATVVSGLAGLLIVELVRQALVDATLTRLHIGAETIDILVTAISCGDIPGATLKLDLLSLLDHL
mmetsp:Transcript_10572/g.22000  ORF Transcript_10572/g.22000 Transcript_10572/m.22000 type:complete len:842 (+) Transcript_10572:184-2709(+)